jgi:hypothetical protein
MARTDSTWKPTSPSPSLKFRTAGFPKYGLKAGISDGTCPINTMQRQSVASVNRSAQTKYLLVINGA